MSAPRIEDPERERSGSTLDWAIGMARGAADGRAGARDGAAGAADGRAGAADGRAGDAGAADGRALAGGYEGAKVGAGAEDAAVTGRGAGSRPRTGAPPPPGGCGGGGGVTVMGVGSGRGALWSTSSGVAICVRTSPSPCCWLMMPPTILLVSSRLRPISRSRCCFSTAFAARSRFATKARRSSVMTGGAPLRHVTLRGFSLLSYSGVCIL